MKMTRSLSRGGRRIFCRRLSSSTRVNSVSGLDRLPPHPRQSRQPVAALHRLVLALFVSLLPWQTVYAAPTATPIIDDIAAATLLVGVVETLDPAHYENWFQAHDLIVTRMWPELHLAEVQPALAVHASQTDVAHALHAAHAQLAVDDAVRHVAFDRPIFAANLVDALAAKNRGTAYLSSDAPADPLYADQWALAQMNVPDAWHITRGHAGGVIAVIDSGVNLGHEDIAADALWVNELEAAGVPGEDDDGNGYLDDVYGWDWADHDGTPHDEFGHGTHVAGIIVATTDNGLGVSGAAPGLRVMPLRVLDDLGEGRVSDLIDALFYAGRHGVRIVNLSLVIQEDVPALHDAIQWSHGQGMLVVAAAGNMRASVLWPAAYDAAVAVAATDEQDLPASFTSMDARVDLAAPGTRILGANRDSVYTMMSGTSMAAAHVSALAGLLWSLRPDLDAPAILEIMQTTAAPLVTDMATPSSLTLPANLGRIDFGAALAAAALDVTVDIGVAEELRLLPGMTVSVPVRVAAGAYATPVEGAVLAYQLALDSDDVSVRTAPIARGQVTSDTAGTATLHLSMSDLNGKCRLTVTLGDNVYSAPMDFRKRPVDIRLAPAQPRVTADDDRMALRIELRDLNGNGVEGAVTLLVSAESGTVAGAMQTMAVTAYDGIADVSVPLSHRSGMLSITALSSGVTATQQIPIYAGAPAKLVVTDSTSAQLSSGRRNDAVDAYMPTELAAMHVAVEDAHGNLVDEQVLVSAEVDNALPHHLDATTVGGVAELTFLPLNATSSIAVHVTLPEHGMTLRHEIAPARRIVLLPLVRTFSLP
jgi:subtilisin family serine protease